MYPSKTHCAMFDINKKDVTSKATTVAQDRLSHAAKPNQTLDLERFLHINNISCHHLCILDYNFCK